MDPLHRRQFLRQAVFGSGAVPILAASRTLNAQQPVPSNPPLQPVHGRILNVSGSALVLEAVEGIRPLSLERARIWRGGVDSAERLQIGDVVWARGLQMPNGRLIVTDLWANIVNVSGRVDTIVSSTTFVMRWGQFGILSDSARKTTVTISDQTVVNDGAPTSRQRLITGKPVQVIGTALDESSIRATRVFV